LQRSSGGGLFAGIFDVVQAFIGFGLLGTTQERILQHIAGGILGERSYRMGWKSGVLGFFLHFTIAFTAATVYYVASRKMRVLVDQPVVCGLLFGETVFLFMYFVVLPLSALGIQDGGRRQTPIFSIGWRNPFRSARIGELASKSAANYLSAGKSNQLRRSA
jgi:hypothetical protein